PPAPPPARGRPRPDFAGHLQSGACPVPRAQPQSSTAGAAMIKGVKPSFIRRVPESAESCARAMRSFAMRRMLVATAAAAFVAAEPAMRRAFTQFERDMAAAIAAPPPPPGRPVARPAPPPPSPGPGDDDDGPWGD